MLCSFLTKISFSVAKKTFLFVFVLIGILSLFDFHQEPRQFLPHDVSIACSFGEGRIGNQMGSFASLFTFERDYGVRSFILRRQMELLENVFKSQNLHRSMKVLEVYYPTWSLQEWKQVLGKTNLTDAATWSANERGKLIDVGLYPNAMSAYIKYLDDLRETFTFKDHFLDLADQMLRNLSEDHFQNHTKDVTFISIHVRRKDYGSHLKFLYNMSYVENEYFRKATKIYRQRFKTTLFYVVSDDPEWVIDILVSPSNDTFYVGSESESSTSNGIGLDLALLSRANHSILTYGTFGMWGALLAGGQALMPASFNGTKEQLEIAEAKIPGWELVL